MDKFRNIIRKLANDDIDMQKDRTNLLNAPNLYGKICRLCLKEDENLKKITCTFKDEITYSDIIWTLLGIKITIQSSTDQSMLCEPCLTNLTLFYKYHEKCNRNNLAMIKLQKCIEYLKEGEPESQIPLDIPPWCDYKYNPIDALESEVMYVEMNSVPFAEQIEIETETEKVKDVDQYFELMDNATPDSDGLSEPEFKVQVPNKSYKNQTCEVCGHVVQGLQKLKRHMRTHEDGYKGRRVVVPIKQVELVPYPAVKVETKISPIKRELESIQENADQLIEKTSYDPLIQASSTAILITSAEVDDQPTVRQKRLKKSICKICGHAVEGKKKLERHLRTHVPGYNANRPVSMNKEDQNPRRKRIINNKYSCPVCQHKVESPNKLKRHMSIHLRVLKKAKGVEQPTERFACKECQCEFPSAEYCRIHEAEHETIKQNKPIRVRADPRERRVENRVPILCYICGKYSAYRSSDMAVHLRRHRGEKPFKCDFCDKAFVTPNGLRAHRRMHTGEKPYQCRYCPMLYSDHTARKEHERRNHTGEKPYPCTFCEKAFVCARVLKHHLTTHTGEKNFGCDICGMLFNKAWNLKAHQNVHAREQGQPLLVIRNKPEKSKSTMRKLVKVKKVEDADPDQLDTSMD